MNSKRLATITGLAFLVLLCLSFDAQAQVAGLDNSGVFSDVIEKFRAEASRWGGVITSAASRLFWALATISMVWTFGIMAVRKAELGEFFAEFIRFIIFTGFYWWLLINAPNFATSIYESLQNLGESASSSGALSPSGIVDVGFYVFDKAVDQSTLAHPFLSLAAILLTAAVLAIFALIAVNMTILLCAGWILAYAGIFFLGFGGARWTSDMAINYYKTVLGVAAQLLAMILIIDLGMVFVTDAFDGIKTGAKVSFHDMGVILVIGVLLWALSSKIPPLIGGIVTGAGIQGIGNVTAGGVAATAGAAVGMTAGAVAATAAAATGGTSALMAAYNKAREDMAAAGGGGGGGNDDWGGGSGGGGGGDDGGGGTPFSKAAGFDAPGSSGGDDNDASGSDGGSPSFEGDSLSGDGGGGDAEGSASSEGQGAGGSGESGGASGGEGQAPNIDTGSGNVVSQVGDALRDTGAALANSTFGRTAGHLARGVMDVAKEKISHTTGGRIAEKIKNPPNPEVAAFVNRK